MSKKVIVKKSLVRKSSTGKVEVVSKTTKAKKAEKTGTRTPQKSISRLVFGFINEHKVLDSDNRKVFYDKLEAIVKKDFPESKFQKTHFYWYLTRAGKQKANKLDMTHLVTIPAKA